VGYDCISVSKDGTNIDGVATVIGAKSAEDSGGAAVARLFELKIPV
jgi:hypothetical protein